MRNYLNITIALSSVWYWFVEALNMLPTLIIVCAAALISLVVLFICFTFLIALTVEALFIAVDSAQNLLSILNLKITSKKGDNDE